MKITSKKEPGSLSIYINDILHLAIRVDELVNIRSWYISPNLDPDPFFIELTYKTIKVICQYDSIDKWKKILELLDN